MQFDELRKALAERSTGYWFSFAEQLLNAIQHADQEKLLAELEAAQYLEPDEIEDLFGFCGRKDIAPGVEPRDIVSAMITLTRLHNIRIHVDPMTVNWGKLRETVVVGSILGGTITRQIKGGYLVDLCDVNFIAFLPSTTSENGGFDLPFESQFCVEMVDDERRQIIVSLV